MNDQPIGTPPEGTAPSETWAIASTACNCNRFGLTPEQALRHELLLTALDHSPIDCAVLWVPRLEAVVMTGVDPGPPQDSPGEK